MSYHSSNSAFKIYYPCSDVKCEEILNSLAKYQWTESQLSELKLIRNNVIEMNKTGKGFLSKDLWIKEAIKYEIIKIYCIETWCSCFEGQIPVVNSFTPYPEFYGALMSSDGVPHYLWGSSDLNSAILQLWLYCNQNEKIFRKVINKTWKIYGGYGKYECGYAGEVYKFTFTLKEICDELR